MPAISPERLKRDVAHLLSQLGDLDAFKRSLDQLFEFYADRTIRPSRAGLPASLLPSHHVPRPVLRKLEYGLAEFAGADPEAALSLAGRLWASGIFQEMLLAVRLVGTLPAGQNGPAVELLMEWSRGTKDESVLEEVFQIAAKKDVKAVLAVLEERLELKRTAQDGALAGLVYLARHAGEDSLPGIYKLYSRALDRPIREQQAGMLALTRELAERSPAETAYFLRQNLLTARRPDLARLLRQCLPLFPEDIQAGLKAMLRGN